MASNGSLSYELLHNREPQVTPLQHGRSLQLWFQALEKAEAVRRKSDPARFFDLHIDEIEADQIGAVERIYEYFDLPVSEAARKAWRARASSDPRGGHASHDYSLEQWGYTPNDVRMLAPTYCERYSCDLQTQTRRD